MVRRTETETVFNFCIAKHSSVCGSQCATQRMSVFIAFIVDIGCGIGHYWIAMSINKTSIFCFVSFRYYG
ncbi:MAG: hypothetical protein IKO86_00685 [Prevotella sp.]|nr:hypothetical protein [Prevotella sp.]